MIITSKSIKFEKNTLSHLFYSSDLFNLLREYVFFQYLGSSAQGHDSDINNSVLTHMISAQRLLDVLQEI